MKDIQGPKISTRSDICESLFSLIYPVFQRLTKENYYYWKAMQSRYR